MKKILASLMMVGLIFCLGGCNVPWMKQKTEKTKAAKVIQADKVEGTMKGMKLKVGVSNDMAPFSYYDSEQKKITGFDIDLLDKLSEYLGFEYELYPMNMKKLEQKIKNKELDLAIAGISITDERQREFSFTDTYYETYLQIVVRKDSQITDRKEITEKKIGVVEGTSSAQYAEDYLSEDNKITYYKNITKVFTIESSGIAPALMTAIELNVPMVILKKQTSKILDDNFYQTEVKSFTKNNIYNLTVSKKYINENDNILVIDDFLANGEAGKGAIRLIESANANVSGIGIVIEKSFQPGREILDKMGYDVYSLARIKSLDNNKIEFLD